MLAVNVLAGQIEGNVRRHFLVVRGLPVVPCYDRGTGAPECSLKCEQV